MFKSSKKFEKAGKCYTQRREKKESTEIDKGGQIIGTIEQKL